MPAAVAKTKVYATDHRLRYRLDLTGGPGSAGVVISLSDLIADAAPGSPLQELLEGLAGKANVGSPIATGRSLLFENPEIKVEITGEAGAPGDFSLGWTLATQTNAPPTPGDPVLTATVTTSGGAVGWVYLEISKVVPTAY